MTAIEIPEAALQAAMSAYANVNAECGEPVEYFPEAMEAALAAAVSVMFDAIGYRDPEEGGFVEDYYAHEPRYQAYTETVYRLATTPTKEASGE